MHVIIVTLCIIMYSVSQFTVCTTLSQHGPGVVYLVLRSRFGKVYLLHTLTPQEPLIQKYTLLAYSDWWIPTFIVKWMVQGYDVQVCVCVCVCVCVYTMACVHYIPVPYTIA